MVIQENGEKPTKAMNPVDSKKYVLVKNHVRELVPEKLEESKNKTPTNSLEKVSNKVSKKRKKSAENVISSDSNSISLTDTCKQDLEELRIVYSKCKAVLNTIEEKYGHLLNLNNVERCSKKRKLNGESHECSCILNKKIMFDDEGKQIIQNYARDEHICCRNLGCNNELIKPRATINISIDQEYYHKLPENLPELNEILKKPDISKSFRNRVIGKIKYIRSYNLNMIRYDKHNLIEKIKSNPNEYFTFKGANLSSLPGYPVPNSK